MYIQSDFPLTHPPFLGVRYPWRSGNPPFTKVSDPQAMRHRKSSQIFPTTRRSWRRDEKGWWWVQMASTGLRKHGVKEKPDVLLRSCKGWFIVKYCKRKTRWKSPVNAVFIPDVLIHNETTGCCEQPILLLRYDYRCFLRFYQLLRASLSLPKFIRRGRRIWCWCRALFCPQQHLAIPRQELEEGLGAHRQMQSEVWSHIVWGVLAA